MFCAYINVNQLNEEVFFLPLQFAYNNATYVCTIRLFMLMHCFQPQFKLNVPIKRDPKEVLKRDTGET